MGVASPPIREASEGPADTSVDATGSVGLDGKAVPPGEALKAKGGWDPEVWAAGLGAVAAGLPQLKADFCPDG